MTHTQNRILVKVGQEMMLVTVSQVTNLKSFRYWSLDQFPVPVSQSDSSDQPKLVEGLCLTKISDSV